MRTGKRRGAPVNRTSREKVLWSELFPHEFASRQNACPLVYLPIGLCEPHGQISAFGLDTIKAEYLCIESARRNGGIVAPTLGYHIHEAGYHAGWLEAEIGETANPHLTAMPPHVLLHFFLYQLRAFANAGFRAIVAVSGHSGGNQADLRAVAAAFMRQVPVSCWVGSDPELVVGQYVGDHAGQYEISQLMHIRPDLVDVSLRRREEESGAGGRYALGATAPEATPELGERIVEASLAALAHIARDLLAAEPQAKAFAPIGYEETEAIWQHIWQGRSEWRTASPFPNQVPVSAASRWKRYEYIR